MKKHNSIAKTLLLGALLICLLISLCACTVGGLTDAQEKKVAELTVYSEADYREAEWKQLRDIYENAVAEITALSDINEVESYDTAAVNARMAAVKTDAQLTAEETAASLETAKNGKIAELTVYKQGDYRAAEWSELSALYENAVAEITALSDINEVESYDTAAVNARMAAIKTDAQLTAEEEAALPAPTITTTLTDGTTYKSDRLTIDVFAKNSAGEKISSTLTLNGETIACNWDDIEKTSYTLLLSEGENTVVISASDGKKQTSQTYTVYFAEDVVTITLSVDCFTIGGGYIIAPTQIRIDSALLADMAAYYDMADADAMKEALCGAYILDYFLYLQNCTIDYTGALDSGFYLATIKGFDFDGSGASVPANLLEKIEESGGSIESTDPADGLGEFCFTWMSGWMYMVNGILPNVGMSDYYPQEGDVFRVQFTLYGYGADIGTSGFGMDPMFEDVGKDRDLLTAAMAKAAAAGKQDTVEYVDALELIEQFGITSDELKEATAALLAVCNT